MSALSGTSKSRYCIYLTSNSPAHSAKLAINGVDAVLKPLLSPGGKYAGKVKVVIRLQVQPWHGASTFTHEAGLAVRSCHQRSPPRLNSDVFDPRWPVHLQKTFGHFHLLCVLVS